MQVRRAVQLVGGCTVLAVGVALLLAPSLGSDGYSTLVNGLAIGLGVPFAVTSVAVAAAFLGVAWWRGIRPNIGTVVQVAVVSGVVQVLLPVLGEPEALALRVAMAAAGMVVLALGIALYLGTHLGAGPAEAPALAFDPPVPFRWGYNLLQGAGALVGWWSGAAVGPVTLVVVLLLGPMVTLAARLTRQQLEPPRTQNHAPVR